MPSIHAPANDPVSQAVLRSVHSRQLHPVPLVATSYDVSITGGLADVVARRTFRNSEAHTIEATLTFPLPVHAVLYALEARIGGRLVKGVAQARQAARQTYEDAIDRGKTAVLHEELLRGVHMLSVAHVAPGTEIEVTARFALSLSWTCGRATLRIPTTVGDIYGSSGLPDSDEIVHGGAAQLADINISSDSGTPILAGAVLTDGKARISLDRPIDVEVAGWTGREVWARAADGRRVTLAITPAPVARTPLDCAILVDHSGSMQETCAGTARLTKHGAVLLGLSAAGDDLTESDRLNLWEFDYDARDLGTAHASGWRTLIHQLAPPAGGTEIGGAIDKLLHYRPVRDVLLITDGKSHALPVQRFAGMGVRFSLVLIGEDSLEANVGHLAALSGGEIFVPAGADVAAAVRSALQAMRAPRAFDDETAGVLRVARGGMIVAAAWAETASEATAAPASRAAAAYAASLRMTRLAEADAAKLAEAEGLVTHLTSLILVDEEGTAQAGLPATRKVALPSPATHVIAAAAVPCMPMRAAYSGNVHMSRARCAVDMGMPASDSGRVKRSVTVEKRARRAPAECAEEVHDATPVPAGPAPAEASRMKSLAHLAARIDWRSQGQKLAEGNMMGLASEIADAIDEAAGYGLVRRLAKRLGLEPRTLVIGLLARAASHRDRHADRVAGAILAKAKTRDVAPLAERLGLEPGRVGA